MRKTSGRRHVSNATDIAEYYASLAATRERIAREEAEREERLAEEAAA
jgi:hypothetical protein